MITRVNKQPTGTKEQFDAVVGKLKTGDDVVFEAIDPHHPELGILTSLAERCKPMETGAGCDFTMPGAGFQSKSICADSDDFAPCRNAVP